MWRKKRLKKSTFRTKYFFTHRFCLILRFIKTKVKADPTSNNTEVKITFSVSFQRQLSEPFLFSVSNCSSFVLSSGPDVLVYEKPMQDYRDLFTSKVPSHVIHNILQLNAIFINVHIDLLRCGKCCLLRRFRFCS